jgi:hypothetical protein
MASSIFNLAGPGAMTFPFETDNICYVPPGEPLRLYDLLGWRRIDLTVHNVGFRLDPHMLPAVHDRAKIALDLAEGDMGNFDRALEEVRVRDFLAKASLAVKSPTSTREFEQALHPIQPTFWARVSQAPMESFHHEDYEQTPTPEPDAPVVLSSIGSVAFNALGQIECDLLSESPHSFHLAAPAAHPAASSTTLDPFEPLPLVYEYCGSMGASSRGAMVAIDSRAQIPESLMAAVPLRRDGDNLYETLYLSAAIATEKPPLRPLTPAQTDQVARSLKAAGFEPKRRSRRFSVWTRGDDAIQAYQGLPGKESEGFLVMPPFCVAALADGSTDCAARFALLTEVLGEAR